MYKRLNTNKIYIMLILIVITIFTIGITFARYKTTRDANFSGRVLKWHLELLDGIDETEETDLLFTRIDNNEDVPDGMIAPGTYGKIPITVDTTGCEVDMDLNLEIEIENCPEQLQFYYRHNDYLGPDGFYYDDIITKYEEETNGSKKIKLKIQEGTIEAKDAGELDCTIYWNWNYYRYDYTIANDINDTNASQFSEIKFSIKAIGTQLPCSPHVYVLLDGDTLRFSHSDFTDEEKEGNTFYGDNYESDPYYGFGSMSRPWGNNQVKNIIIENKITPVNLDGWFQGVGATSIVNIENLDTSYATTMAKMFANTDFETLDLSHFDTSKVIRTWWMFYNCENLKSVNLSSFNTSIMNDMRSMFEGCSSLEEIDLSSFDTSNVEQYGLMFRGCTNLKTIFVDEFDTSNSNYDYDMFLDCTSLVGGSGTIYDPNYIDITYARIDNQPDEPGYFTKKTN